MLGARRAQAWRYHPAYRRPEHLHDESEFNLVVAGRGVMTLGAERVDVRSGMLLWIPPGLRHGLEWASSDFDLLVVGFQPELLDRLPSGLAQADPFTPRAELFTGDVHPWAEALAATAQEGDRAAVEAQLMDALVTFAHARGGARVTERAARLLQRERGLGRDELARRLGINRGDLSRRFQRDHAASIAEFKNRLKVVAFLRETAERPGNLMQAALAAGFGSYSQCHRVFHQLFGVAPRDYIARGGIDPDRFEPWPAVDPLAAAARQPGVTAAKLQ